MYEVGWEGAFCLINALHSNFYQVILQDTNQSWAGRQAAGNINIYVILTVRISLRFFVDTDDEELDFSRELGIFLISDLFCSAFNKMILKW